MFFRPSHRQPRPLVAALHLAFVAALGVGFAAPAMAQTAPGSRQYDISAGPLDQVLTRFAQQAGVAVATDAASLKGLQSKGLHGKYGVEEGFAVLLRGSGYGVGKTSDGYVLVPAEKVSVAEIPEKPTQLTPIEVRSAAETGSAYYRPIASSATKTDTPLMQTPMTVEVLPKTMLEEMGVVNTGLADVVKYSGVTTLGPGPSGDMFFMRGFLTTTTLWNGFRIEDFDTSSGLNAGTAWLGNVAGVEIIKGPASILYGRIEPGGAVSLLTNQPQETSRTTVTAGVGSWSDRWLGIDSTGALNEDKTLRYRINLAKEESDTWFHWNRKNRSQGIAPALEWRISPQTTLSYEGLYRTVEGYSTNAVVPWDTTTGQWATNDPKKGYIPDSYSKHELSRSVVGLNHRFDESWSISLKYLHDEARTPTANYAWVSAPFTFPVTPGNWTIGINNGWNIYSLTTDATVLDVTGHVTALGINHTILLGADYYRKRGNGRSAYDWSGTQTTNYFDPIANWNIPLQNTSESSGREMSIYLQDQMALPGHWHMLVGGRYQRLTEDSTNNGVSNPHYTKDTFLPRLGVLWQPMPWLSTYYSYSENSSSNLGKLDYTGALLKPEYAKQHELGVKTEWLEGRLSAQLSVFDLTKYNVALNDAAHPGFNIAAGEIRSRGFEFNLQGEITKNWNVLFNYSHANPVAVGNDVPSPWYGQMLKPGTTLPMVPTRSFSLWTSYRLPQEALQGWKIGGGYNWTSAPTPYPVQPFPTPSYETVSAFASYDTKIGGYKTTVQLNIDNLFDKKYQYMGYDPTNSGLWNVSWGDPRKVRLSLKTEF
ncbi:MAG: TonB-dependent receptor [Deltaproteobacteria bacterium]|nr:TonB-dependent receptor [Deltaproteobacteria bacterium]